MENTALKSVLEYCVQCQRSAPCLTPIQIAILMVLMDEDRPMTYTEIARRLMTSNSMVSNNAKFMLAKGGQDVIKRVDGKIIITEKGAMYCRSLITNTTQFLNREFNGKR